MGKERARRVSEGATARDVSQSQRQKNLFFNPDDGDWKQQSTIAGCRLGRFCDERRGFTTFRVDQEQQGGSISYDHQPGGGFDQHFGVQRKRLADMRASLSLPVRWIEIKQLTAGTRGVFNEEGHATLCGEADESTTGTGNGSRMEIFHLVEIPGHGKRLSFIVRSQHHISSCLTNSFNG